MFEIKGKYLISRYYARHIPFISKYIYEMSLVQRSSLFYSTTPFHTRLVDLNDDFFEGYSPRLQKYIRSAEKMDLTVKRPPVVLDIMDIYQSVIEAKNLNPLLPDAMTRQEHFFYSEIYHPNLGRLAVHLNIGDWKEKRVFGFINASNFRSFNLKEHQQLCSTANKFLYHQDMLFFKSLNYKYFDFVGIREPMNQMKKQFGGDIVMTYRHIPYPIYWLKNMKKLLGSKS